MHSVGDRYPRIPNIFAALDDSFTRGVNQYIKCKVIFSVTDESEDARPALIAIDNDHLGLTDEEKEQSYANLAEGGYEKLSLLQITSLVNEMLSDEVFLLARLERDSKHAVNIPELLRYMSKRKVSKYYKGEGFGGFILAKLRQLVSAIENIFRCVWGTSAGYALRVARKFEAKGKILSLAMEPHAKMDVPVPPHH